MARNICLTALVLLLNYQIILGCPYGCWSKWMDRDDPGGKGDYETLHDLRKRYPGKICSHPTDINYRVVGKPFGYGYGYNVVTATPTYGFSCVNAKQGYHVHCKDYEVRFCCPKQSPPPKCGGSSSWSTWFDRDNAKNTGDWELLSKIRHENPGKVCEYPSAIDARLTNGKPYYYAGEHLAVFSKHEGLVCKNKDQRDGSCHDYKVRFCCPRVVCNWTMWFNRDKPSVTGDYETLDKIRKEYPGKVCQYPLKIDAKQADGRPIDPKHNKVHVSLHNGFICKIKEQECGYCEDYKVRFYCCW